MFFFSSDLHFGSENILKTDNRPFKDTKSFNRFVIKTWNSQVNVDDIIYIIGDFVDYHDVNKYQWEDSLRLVKKIKCDVILIVGNNEKRIIKNCFNNDFNSFKSYCLSIGFKDVLENTFIRMLDREFYLTHKAKDCNKGMLNLFGHSHRACGIYKSFGFNVGCDLSHFRLLSENDINSYLYMKEKYWDEDENLKLM